MEVTSTGLIKKVMRSYNLLRKVIVDVGVVEPQIKRKNGRNTQLATIYQVQEQGSTKKKIPARPTLKDGIKDAKYQPRIKNLVGNIAAGNGLIGLDKIGEVASLKVKSNIQGIKKPALQKETITSRINAGTTNPLVDTGQLKKSIDFKVNKK